MGQQAYPWSRQQEAATCREAELVLQKGQRLARSYTQLPLHQVEPRHGLCHRVLHLRLHPAVWFVTIHRRSTAAAELCCPSLRASLI